MIAKFVTILVWVKTDSDALDVVKVTKYTHTVFTQLWTYAVLPHV